MQKLKRKILNTVLACVLTLTASAKSKNIFPITPSEYLNNHYQFQTKTNQEYFQIQNPRTLEDCGKIFDKYLRQESKREELLLRNLEAQNIISKYYFNNQTPSESVPRNFYPTEYEFKIIKRAGERIIKNTLRETRRDISEIEDLEENLITGASKIFTGFYFSLMGPNANGHTGIPTLDEETRQDSFKREERFKALTQTVKELGRKYRVTFDGKWDYNLVEKNPKKITLTNLVQGLETEASVSDFKILGARIHKLKIKAKSNQEAKISMTKIFNNEWYTVLSLDYDCAPRHLNCAAISLIQEKPNWYIGITIGKRKTNNKDMEDFANLNLFKRF